MHTRSLGWIGAMALIVALTTPSVNADPLADPSASQPSVSDYMGLMQLRHIKLWYAGSNRNWPLLKFEAAKMRETIARAARSGNLPEDRRAMLDRALLAIAEAATRREERAFLAGYASVTDDCNQCHRKSNVEFIRIMTPTRSPFSDQAFDSPSSASDR